MDLVDMLSTIWRSKWIILTTAIVAASVVAFSSFRQNPTYQAESVLVVGNLATGSTLGRFGGEDKLAASYSDLIQTSVVLQRAIEQAGLETTPAALRGHISSTTGKESPYFRIQATDYSAAAAIEEVNAVSEGLVSYLDALQDKNVAESRQKIVDEIADIEKEQDAIRNGLAKDDGRLKALDEVKLSLIKQYEENTVQEIGGSKLRIVSLAETAGSNPTNAWRNTLIAFFAGALAGTGIGFAVEAVRKAIRRED